VFREDSVRMDLAVQVVVLAIRSRLRLEQLQRMALRLDSAAPAAVVLAVVVREVVEGEAVEAVVVLVEAEVAAVAEAAGAAGLIVTSSSATESIADAATGSRVTPTIRSETQS
jgi:hypothetical protein